MTSGGKITAKERRQRGREAAAHLDGGQSAEARVRQRRARVFAPLARALRPSSPPLARRFPPIGVGRRGRGRGAATAAAAGGPAAAASSSVNGGRAPRHCAAPVFALLALASRRNLPHFRISLTRDSRIEFAFSRLLIYINNNYLINIIHLID